MGRAAGRAYRLAEPSLFERSGGRMVAAVDGLSLRDYN
jgi:hypothetical protein